LTNQISTWNPATGVESLTAFHSTTADELDETCERSGKVAPTFAATSRSDRAYLLRSMSRALEADRERIVHTADSETALGSVRLNGELTRSCYQLELFADVIEEGSYLEAVTMPDPRRWAYGPTFAAC